MRNGVAATRYEAVSEDQATEAPLRSSSTTARVGAGPGRESCLANLVLSSVPSRVLFYPSFHTTTVPKSYAHYVIWGRWRVLWYTEGSAQCFTASPCPSNYQQQPQAADTGVPVGLQDGFDFKPSGLVNHPGSSVTVTRWFAVVPRPSLETSHPDEIVISAGSISCC